MNWNQWILCILGIGLLLNCNKGKVAQVDLSVKLQTNKAYFPSINGIDTTKAFKIEVKIRTTDKVSEFYPKAKFYLKYKMLDKQGNSVSDFLYFVDVKTNPNVPLMFPLKPDTFTNIPYSRMTTIVNTDYNIAGKSSNFLKNPYYRIIFTLIVRDSVNNQLIDVPTVTPNEAVRTFEVIIDTLNTNKANYSLSYKKNFYQHKFLPEIG